jgi:flagellar motor switch protein FliG
MSAVDRSSSSGLRKAAILLSILDEAEAAPVLRSMPGADQARIAEEMAKLPQVSTEAALHVLEEYRQVMTTQDVVAAGGRDVAVRLLVKALGENGAKGIIERMNREDDGQAINVNTLKKTEPEKVVRFLSGEHAQTKAFLLGQLDARQASALLMKLEPEARADCVKRMATMGQLSSHAAAKAFTVINRRFGSPGEATKQTSPGSKNLADLMNRLEPAAAREILETIESTDPTLAISIRDLMFTFENFIEVPEPDLRELMVAVDKKTLTIALKGASEDLKTHIYRTMSSRAVEMLKEDSEMMGPVRGKDVAKAQSEMIAIARKLEAEGKIVLRSQGEDEYVL